MNTSLIHHADCIGLFCRLQMNTKMDIPIRPSQMGVLIFIQREETSVTPLMISDFFKMSKPSVSSILTALAKQDYIMKEPSPIDGRSYTVKTTLSGEKLVKTTFKEYLKSVEYLHRRMGKSEFNQLISLIDTANGILEEMKP